MSDGEPTAAISGNDWLDDIHGKLGQDTETIKAALEDVAAMCVGDATPVGWVDVRQQPQLTVYVIHDGIVHVVSGERDRRPDQRTIDDRAETRASWRTVPVSRGATCSLMVIRTAPSVGDADVAREWGLRFGDAPDTDLAVAYPPDRDAYPKWSDPSPFARALAREIARVQAMGGDA